MIYLSLTEPMKGARVPMNSGDGLRAVTDVLKNARKVVAGYFMPKDAMKSRGVSGARPTLAILASPELSQVDYSKLRSRMLLDLSSVTGTRDFDVLVLNDAPPRARYDVVYHSKGIYCSSRPERAAFEERTIMDYLDAKAIQELVRRDGTDV